MRRFDPAGLAALGATTDDGGTTFAVSAPGADGVDLCLFDERGTQTDRVPMLPAPYGRWQVHVPGAGPGLRYGLRASGPYRPSHGLMYNPAKLLQDPYARAIDGGRRLDPAAHHSSPANSAPYVPRSVVVDPAFDWGDDERPQVPWERTVLYEAHVRGLTMLHPAVPHAQRGTYAGLAHPAVVEHLLDLGVTSVELLPVHHFTDESRLLARGLSNYWGYNTLGYFAPHAGYSSTGVRGEQVGEFKRMVAALHAAGLEVILDVVYNHTSEGDENGPTLAFRGLDNRAYYRLREEYPGHYVNITGCGNTLDAGSPVVIAMILDSLRYWAGDMHVDGFRFDLAPVLGRPRGGFDPCAPVLAAIATDPQLARLKLVAEPWDATSDGYTLGRFGAPWAEWNGRFRDEVRDFWRGWGSGVGHLATRLSGSSDLFGDGRRPFSSINFVACHDGFPLADLVRYATKHNEANAEDNRDGESDNRGDNHGVEGPTRRRDVIAVRRRQVRNLMATTLLSSGTPLITAGDERGRTQGGNNNAYCQDSPVSWVDWGAPPPDAKGLAEFTAALLRLRRDHPVLRPRAFFVGRPAADGARQDLAWFDAGGTEMTQPDWHEHGARTLVMFRSGDASGDASFLLVLHADERPADVVLPGPPWADRWLPLVDTGTSTGLVPDPAPLPGGARLRIRGRTLMLLQAG